MFRLVGKTALTAFKGMVVRLVLPTVLSGPLLGDVAECFSTWPKPAMDASSTSDQQTVSAAEEYQRNPDLRPEDIQQLREWLATQKHLPPITEEMIIVFHHSCYYDLDRTKICIENYYTMRTHMTEFFTERDMTNPQLSKALQALYLAPLPVPDPKTGYCYMYHGLRSSDPSKYAFVEAIKLTLMMFDAFGAEQGTTPGYAVIFDMEGTRLGHLMRVSLSALGNYSKYLQEANPVRLKAIHMVNSNFLVDKSVVLAKPFLKKELYDSICIHKPGSRSLYDHIPRECLPAELGGTLESKEVYCADFAKKLKMKAGFFRADELNRVNEALREKKKNVKAPKESTSADTEVPTTEKQNLQ